MGWIILAIGVIVCVGFGLTLCVAAKDADKQLEDYYNELRMPE